MIKLFRLLFLYLVFCNFGVLYAQEREVIKVVYMGDSITEQWKKLHPNYFNSNNICKGISGQTTSQMLIRFRKDVVDMGGDVVVILAGTNDIAGNNGKMALADILDNIKSMCDISKANNIKVILCSILPAHSYYWNKDANPSADIPQLNSLIEQYANENNIRYVDFFSKMVDKTQENYNGLLKHLTIDGVHLNNDGYLILEKVLNDSI